MNKWFISSKVTQVWAAMLLFALLTSAARSAQSTPPITYERYDVALDLQTNGDFIVREIQQIRFDDEFQTAFADIPIDLTAGIEDIQIYEGDQPYVQDGEGPGSFRWENDGSFILVDWTYTPTQPGDVRTFTLEYRVTGGVWIYPAGNILEWRAVPADRSDIVVESSVVTVTLPAAVADDQLRYAAYGPRFQTAVTTTQNSPTPQTQVIFSADEALRSGTQFQVQVGFPNSLIRAQVQDWQQREDSAAPAWRFKALDTVLTLEADGSLWVDEFHQIAVDAGGLDQGYRTFSLRFLDAIDNVRLSEGEQSFVTDTRDCDYCLQIDSTPRAADWVAYDPRHGAINIDNERAGHTDLAWQFPALVRGEETTLHLRYRVQGALQILPDKQQLNWTAVFRDRTVPVESAGVRLQLPPGIALEDVQISGGTVEPEADGTVLVRAPGPIQEASPWEIQISLPPNATTAAPPRWQLDLAAAVVAERQAVINRARLQLGFGVGALVLLVLGLAAIFALWYTRGRDKPVPAVADYLPEPPSDLPPAIVAYLLDEEPTTKGALASLFHLATLGLIQVQLTGGMAIKRTRANELQAGENVQTPTGATVSVPAHLATLFNALQPVLPAAEETPFYKIEPQFQTVLPRVYTEMGAEATRFFDELPDTARRRWLVLGQWLVLLGIGAAVVLALWLRGSIGWIAIAPAVALTVLGLALIGMSRWMPRRTNLGAQEAQRWIAFRTYLRNLKQYGTLDAAQQVLDRYFAYAVALDVEDVVLEQAEALGSWVPAWTFSPDWSGGTQWRSRPRRDSQPDHSPSTATQPTATAGGTTTPSMPATRPPQAERPSLSGLSRQMGEALTAASRNLGTLFSTATESNAETPFSTLQDGAGAFAQGTGRVASTTFDIIGAILESASSGDGGGGYSGGSSSSSSSWSSSSSRRSSSSRSSSRSSSSSAGRSSSSRRSGGGGRRGFG